MPQCLMIMTGEPRSVCVEGEDHVLFPGGTSDFASKTRDKKENIYT